MEEEDIEFELPDVDDIVDPASSNEIAGSLNISNQINVLGFNDEIIENTDVVKKTEEEKPATKRRKTAEPKVPKELKDTKEPKAKKAPPKEKKKTLAGDDASNAILEYMVKQNRPYSAQNVYDNLHGVVPKAHVEKWLVVLHEQNQLLMKEYGKFKVFLAKQSNEGCDEEELKAMDNSINQLQKEMESRNEKVRELKSSARKFATVLTEEDLLKKELAAKESLRLARESWGHLQSVMAAERQSSGDIDDPNELLNMKKEYETICSVWRKYRQVGETMAKQAAPQLGMTWEEVLDELGLDTDEQWDVTLPKK